MKINPEQINQLRNQEQSQQRTQKNQEDFARLLNQEAEKANKADPAATGKSGNRENISSSTYLQVSLLNNNPSESTAMDNLDNILSKWERYADQLNSPQSSLKDAYAGLEEISRAVEDMKEKVDPDKHGAQIRNVLNELDVMTTTEMIKFNRGDYLS
jgi:DNA repair ATPase RecN